MPLTKGFHMESASVDQSDTYDSCTDVAEQNESLMMMNDTQTEVSESPMRHTTLDSSVLGASEVGSEAPWGEGDGEGDGDERDLLRDRKVFFAPTHVLEDQQLFLMGVLEQFRALLSDSNFSVHHGPNGDEPPASATASPSITRTASSSSATSEEVEFEFETLYFRMRRVDDFYFVLGHSSRITIQHMDVVVMLFKYLAGPLQVQHLQLTIEELCQILQEVYAYACEEVGHMFPAIAHQPSQNVLASIMYSCEAFLTQVESMVGNIATAVFCDDLLLHSHLSSGIEKYVSSKLGFIKSREFAHFHKSGDAYVQRTSSQSPVSAHRILCRNMYSERDRTDYIPVFLSTEEQRILLSECRTSPLSFDELASMRKSLATRPDDFHVFFPSGPDGDWFGLYIHHMDRFAFACLMFPELMYDSRHVNKLRLAVQPHLVRLSDTASSMLPIVTDVSCVTPGFRWAAMPVVGHSSHGASRPSPFVLSPSHGLSPTMLTSPDASNLKSSSSMSSLMAALSPNNASSAMSPNAPSNLSMSTVASPGGLDSQSAMSVVTYEAVLNLAQGCVDLERDPLVRQAREYMCYDHAVSMVVLKNESGSLFARSMDEREVFVRSHRRVEALDAIEANARQFLYTETKQVHL
jgi:hypothetical protein